MTADAGRFHVLVIEGESQIRRLLHLTLTGAGYAVAEAETGTAAIAAIESEAPDAILLDVSLPDMSGLALLGHLRERSAAPVLVLSDLTAEECKIAALDAGADDCLTKPFGEGELLARLRALLRRIKPAIATNTFRFGSVEVDFGRRRVRRDGSVVKLTATEYALLLLFITHRDKALSHRHILRELWGPKAEGQTHYLRTYMMRLRRKLEDELDTPRFFQTESGIGYRFVTEPQELTV